jgi:hypothetical protein
VIADQSSKPTSPVIAYSKTSPDRTAIASVDQLCSSPHRPAPQSLPAEASQRPPERPQAHLTSLAIRRSSHLLTDKTPGAAR